MSSRQADSEQSPFEGGGADSALKPERSRSSHRRRHRSKRMRQFQRWFGFVRWRIILLVIVVALVIVGAGGLVLVTNAFNRLEQSQNGLNRVLDSLNNKPADQWTFADFERLQSSVQDLLGSLEQAESRTFFLRPVKQVDGDLEATFGAIDTAQEVSLGVDTMLTGLQPTLFFLTEGQEDAGVTQISSGERVIELLELGRSNFLTANQHFDSARTMLDSFEKAKISPDLLLILEEIDRYQQQAKDINSVLLNAPDLLRTALGMNGTQTYLILSQNNDEIRPSGGYISTYGWMTIRNSRVVEFDYRPTTISTPNPPPANLADTLQVPAWWIHYQDCPVCLAWDGSWYADFPSTAALAAWYYDNGNNPEAPVDGVIALDIDGLQLMLEGLGTVDVPGFEEEVDSANFREVIYDIRATEAGEAHKQFLAALYREVLAAWQSTDPSRKSDVLGAQLRALREKHMMLYFTDDNLNQALDILGWSGQQNDPAGHDYLMIADANVGASKSNRSIIRDTTYDVEILADGTLNSRATINYNFSDAVASADPAVRPENYRVIDYFNQMQVFVPLGSQLGNTANTTGTVVQDQTDHHSIFTALIWVDYDSSQRVQYAYTTPMLVEQFGDYYRYRLLIQKQPGMQTERVSVQVRLPRGASTVDVIPDPLQAYTLEQPILEFRLDLERDKWIEIIYQVS